MKTASYVAFWRLAFVITLVGCAASDEADDPTSATAPARVSPSTASSCPVLDHRGWTAMVDRMPNPNGPRLVVTGRIDLPTPGYIATWREGPADRMMPPAQILELVLTPPDGVVAQVVTTMDVRYDGPARFPTYRAIRVRCGDASLAEITTIQTVH